jgi:hypothetical protein
MTLKQIGCGVLVIVIAAAGRSIAAGAESQTHPPIQLFLAAAGPDKAQAEAAMKQIAESWHDGYASMIVDLARFLPPLRRPRFAETDPAPGDFNEDETGAGRAAGSEFPTTPRQLPGADIRQRLIAMLQRQTGKRFGDDLRAWRKWIWAQPPNPHPDYAELKAEVYGRIDPRMRAFFPKGVSTAIRLDEIDWGGVPINGIPPLRQPKTITADSATSWLRDNHVVFGVDINGEARAYPKRILAWHEMAIDRLGGVDLTIVYCTLCGTVIPYESTVAGRQLRFGTSGLLYRSNKLMFDEETASLWSALEGVPVVGALAGSGIRLPFHAVVTTTWGEWRREHPSTTVLSLDTGFTRDYSEGAAYRDYFSSDRLMFEVPVTDTRLKNKAEVVVMRPGVLGANSTPLAIAADKLRRTPVFPFEHDGQRLVAITSKAGANRIYLRRTHEFRSRESDGTVADSAGGRWRVTSGALVSTAGEALPAVPTHRVFWFGWIAQHPSSALIR